MQQPTAPNAKPPPEPVALLRGHRAAVTCVEFLYGSDEFLVSGDADGHVLIWALPIRRVTESLMDTHPGGVLTVVANAKDDRWISQGRTDGCVKVWKKAELTDVVRTESESFCRAAILWRQCAENTYTLACTTRDESIVAVWDENSTASKKFLKPLSEERWGMAMDLRLIETQDSSQLAFIVYEDGYLRGFDVLKEMLMEEMVIKVQPAESPATSLVLCLSDDDSAMRGLVGGASADLCSFVLDLKTGKAAIRSFLPAAEKLSVTKNANEEESRLGRGIGQLALRPDARICAVASWDHRIRILHFRTGKHVALLKHHRDSVYCVAFSSNSKLLASGSKDQNIAIWSIYPPESV